MKLLPAAGRSSSLAAAMCRAPAVFSHRDKCAVRGARSSNFLFSFRCSSRPLFHRAQSTCEHSIPPRCAYREGLPWTSCGRPVECYHSAGMFSWPCTRWRLHPQEALLLRAGNSSFDDERPRAGISRLRSNSEPAAVDEEGQGWRQRRVSCEGGTAEAVSIPARWVLCQPCAMSADPY